MRSLHMVHRQFTCVGFFHLRDGIFPECGLQEKISSVRVVLQNRTNRCTVKLLPVAGTDAVRIQCVCNQLGPYAIEEHGEDPLYNRGFLRHDHKSTIFIPVSKHGAGPWATFFEVLLDPPFLVFTD